LFIIILVGFVLAGCATTPQGLSDVARAETEHPFLSQVAINLPTPQEMDVLVTSVPSDWGKGIANRTIYVPIPHGIDSVRVISPDNSRSFRVSRGNARILTSAEKSAWWETIRNRSGGGKIVLQDPETGEVMTVTPLSPKFLEAAAVSAMTEKWQRAAACGLMKISTSDIASQGVTLGVRLVTGGICYSQKGPNVLQEGGTFTNQITTKAVNMVRHSLRTETCSGLALRCNGSAIFGQLSNRG
jgi:hypothetical protein